MCCSHCSFLSSFIAGKYAKLVGMSRKKMLHRALKQHDADKCGDGGIDNPLHEICAWWVRDARTFRVKCRKRELRLPLPLPLRFGLLERCIPSRADAVAGDSR